MGFSRLPLVGCAVSISYQRKKRKAIYFPAGFRRLSLQANPKAPRKNRKVLPVWAVKKANIYPFPMLVGRGLFRNVDCRGLFRMLFRKLQFSSCGHMLLLLESLLLERELYPKQLFDSFGA